MSEGLTNPLFHSSQQPQPPSTPSVPSSLQSPLAGYPNLGLPVQSKNPDTFFYGNVPYYNPNSNGTIQSKDIFSGEGFNTSSFQAQPLQYDGPEEVRPLPFL